MTKPHRLAWFQDNIGKNVRRKELFDAWVIDIYIQDERKANILYYTQFDIGLRYFV